MTEQIVGAELRLYNPKDGVFGAPSTYTLRSVETPVNTLGLSHSPGAPGIAIYADLADGTVFGSFLGSSANNDSVVSIPLNAAALTSLNGSLGQKFAFAGNFDVQGTDDHFILATRALAPIRDNLCLRPFRNPRPGFS